VLVLEHRAQTSRDQGGQEVSFEIIEFLPHLRFRLRIDTDVDAEASMVQQRLQGLLVHRGTLL
jgi:hypothetical protein